MVKLSYFGYSVSDHETQVSYLFDIRHFVRAFADFNDVNFKNRFTHVDENVYLIHQAGSLYLFLITRRHEIIKKIKSNDLSISEIYDALSKDETLGFASYVYFDKHFLGFASTIMAPKSKTFAEFINKIFESIGLDRYTFTLHPLMNQYTQTDALQMEFIGRSIIQVTKENKWYEDLVNIFNGSSEQFTDVDSFEIIVKPRRKQNIAPAAKKIINEMEPTGLDKLLIKAKEEVGADLIEVYLAGKGQVADEVDRDDENTILQKIKVKAAHNPILQTKVQDHEANDEFEKKEPIDFTNLHNASSWSDRISDLQVPEQ